MIGIIIYEKNNDSYLGTGTPICLSDYCEHKKLGDKIKKYIDSYIDYETQRITFSPYAMYDAKELCSDLQKDNIDVGILLYCDCDERLYEYAEDFIGYDVCSCDYFASPLGLNYLALTSESLEILADCGITDAYPFVENLDDEVRYGYADKLNSYMLFEDKEAADEIAEYCNWLDAQYDDFLEGFGDFRTVRIYKVEV